jgi:hypothetical protein
MNAAPQLAGPGAAAPWSTVHATVRRCSAAHRRPPTRDHYAEDQLTDADVLAAYRQRQRWLFRTSRGMNMWEGPDASQSRMLVIGIMHEGTPEVVILHTSLKSAQRHSTGRMTRGDQG